MVVALVTRCLFAELDRLLRTPLDAGKALFAVMTPDGSVCLQVDVSTGADVLADAAGIAFLINPESLVHRRNAGKGEPVEPGKNDILPQGALFDRPLLPCSHRGGDSADLFPCRLDPPDLLRFGSGAAPGDVVGRHRQFESGEKG